MYEIICQQCGQIGFHPSRTGAESRADVHYDEFGHQCRITSMAES